MKRNWVHIYFNRRTSAASGSGTLLLFAILIPTTFFLAQGIFGLYEISTRRGEVQSVIDAVVLQGARYLPNQPLAKSFVEQEVRRRLGAAAVSEVSTKGSSISIKTTLNTNTTPLFKLFTNRGSSTSFTVSAWVTAAPQDVVIFFDSSQYVAPLAYMQSKDRAWLMSVRKHKNNGLTSNDQIQKFQFFEGFGELDQNDATRMTQYISLHEGRNLSTNQLLQRSAPEWLSASLFSGGRYRDGRLANGEIRNSELKDDLIANANHPLLQLYYSQRCFNPVFSAIKQAAIHLFDYYSASKLNRVAVLSGPISGSVIHPSLRWRDILSVTKGGFVDGGDPFKRNIAQLENSKGVAQTLSDPRVRDQECWSAMDIESQRWNALSEENKSSFRSLDPRRTIYVEPQPAAYFNVNAVLPPSPAYQGTSDELDRASTSRLTARDAIWARSVSTRRVEFDILMKKIGEVIDDAPSNTMKRARGDDASRVQRTVFLLLGDFPWFATPLGAPPFSVVHPPYGLYKRSLTPEDRSLFEPSTNPDYYPKVARELQSLHIRFSSKFPNEKMKLYMAIPRTEGSYAQDSSACGDRLECRKFADHFHEFSQFLINQKNNWPSLEVIALPASDSGTLALDMIGTLLTSAPHYYLSHR